MNRVYVRGVLLTRLLGCPTDEATHTDLLQMAVNAIVFGWFN
jgi:hypothetical protein